jgi:hypothetical protein
MTVVSSFPIKSPPRRFYAIVSAPTYDGTTMPRGTGTSAPWPSDRFTLLLAVVTAAGSSAAQNLTVCATNQLDWYTSVVRETPCRTYERLRQICDKDCACFLPWHEPLAADAVAPDCKDTVGQFNNTAPGDSCNSPCCCNSIAWNLSMLCLKCGLSVRALSVADR